MKRTRVLLTIPSLGGGGAERVFTTLMNHLSPERFDLHLALVNKCGLFLDDVPRHVEIHDLHAGRVLRAALPLRRLIRRLRPAVAFSTASHMNIALAALRRFLPSETRVIVRENNVADSPVSSKQWKFARTRLMRTFLPAADVIVCQSEFMRDDLCKNLRLPRHKTTVIYNPVDLASIAEQAAGDNPFHGAGDGPNLVAIGSMERPKKGFDRLIRALPSLIRRRPQAVLWIVGQGRLKDELQSLADDLEIADHVRFVGFQNNPFSWLKHADLFVLSSRHEGTPNVLLEATACGCPAVVLDHPGGTREVMELLGQSSRVVDRLEDWNPAWFDKPEPQALDRAVEHFGAEKVAQQYAALLTGVGHDQQPRSPRLAA